MGIDIVESVRAQCEALEKHAEELLALSVNVENLRELARVQHDALERLRDSYTKLANRKPVRDMAETLGECSHAIAKYNEMMGGGDE